MTRRNSDNAWMGNLFTAHGTGAAALSLSNGGTDVLFDVLTLASSTLAQTPWPQHFTLHFADGHRHSRGFSGFDLSDLPWSPAHPTEKASALEIIALAATRHRWDRLAYDPPLRREEPPRLPPDAHGLHPGTILSRRLAHPAPARPAGAVRHP